MANEHDGPGRGPEGSDVQQRLQREAEAARQSAQRIGEKAQQQAGEVSSDLQAQAQRMVSEQKEMARSGLMDLVSAVRSAANDLEQHQQSQFANVARSVAGGLEDFSQSIGRRNFQDMLSDAQRFARDHPAAFFGGAVLAGLAIARFAKSSSEHQHPSRISRQSEGFAAEQSGQSGTRYATQRAGQGGQLSEFARQEREHGRGVDTGTITR